jgi:hypothetical protein
MIHMISFRIKVGAAVMAGSLAILVTQTGIAMASDSACTGAAGDPWPVCTAINGSGLHVNYMTGYTTNESGGSASNLHIELEGPPGTLKNCATFSLRPGVKSPVCKWSPNANEPAGEYCATLWQLLSSGKYDDVWTTCVPVN